MGVRGKDTVVLGDCLCTSRPLVHCSSLLQDASTECRATDSLPAIRPS